MSKDDQHILELQLESEKQKAETKKPLGLVAAATICVAGALLLYSGQGKDNDGHFSFSATVASEHSDHVTAEQKFVIETQFMVYQAKLLPENFNDKEVQASFLSSQYLDHDTLEKLTPQLQSGEYKLGSITLWDNFDQDGDVVTIQTAGTEITVPIYHNPQTILIPYRPGDPLLIHGTRDGGGGITAAVATTSGEVPLPPMAVGQVIELPMF